MRERVKKKAGRGWTINEERIMATACFDKYGVKGLFEI